MRQAILKCSDSTDETSIATPETALRAARVPTASERGYPVHFQMSVVDFVSGCDAQRGVPSRSVACSRLGMGRVQATGQVMFEHL